MNRLRNDNPPTLDPDPLHFAEPEPAPEPPAKLGCLALLLVAVLWLVMG